VERTLHRDFYFSDEIFQCGRDRIFHREWFCAGRVEELRQLGDYVAPNVAGESVLVVRTRDGVLSAHYNGSAIAVRVWFPKAARARSPEPFVAPTTPGRTVWMASSGPPRS
jgi:hypothetical protein